MKLLLALVFLGVATAATAALPTNMAATLTLRLNTISQGPTNGLNVAAPAATITAKNVIAAIGHDLNMSFSAKAQMIVVFSITYSITNEVRYVYVGGGRFMIKDGKKVVDIGSFLSGSQATSSVFRHKSPVENKYAIANISITPSELPISLHGFETGTLLWNARTAPIYSETWSSMTGAVGDALAQGSVSLIPVAYNVPY